MSIRKFNHWTAAVPRRLKLLRYLGYPRKLARVVGDPRPRVGTFFASLRELSSRYECGSSLTPFEFRVFSQNGEDGVIAEIVRRIGKAFPHSFVEFGGGNGLAGNTLFLGDVLGWHGLFIEAAEADYAKLELKYRWNARVSTVRSFVSPENIAGLLEHASFRGDIGVFSIDVDGNDFYIWRALKARPVLVIIEYNGAIPLGDERVQPFSSEPWDGSDYYGASLASLESLGRTLGYVLVHTELTGTNAFFVRDDFTQIFADLEPPRRIVNQELLGFAHPRDTKGRQYVSPTG